MITQKIKSREFFYYFSRSIQNIAHHLQSKKDRVISEGGGGVCMPFFANKPNILHHSLSLFDRGHFWDGGGLHVRH